MKLVNNFADARALEGENKRQASATYARLEAGPGGVAAFRDALKIVPLVNDDEYAHLAEIWSGVSSDDFEETTAQSAAYAFARGLAASADIAAGGEDFNRESGLMTGRPSAFVDDIKARLKLYHGTLKSLFPVPGEVDHIHVFRDIALKGNFDSRLKEQIGAYRDFSLMLCHPGTNEIIGGTDFVVYIHKDGPPTAQANFTFLKSQYRGLKFARKLLDARAEAALKFIQETDPAALRRANGFYWFVEQNRPEAMGALSYVRDIAYSLDPIERLKIWAKFGFARLDCRYDQPALGPNEDPCRILSLNTSFRRVNEGSDGTFELGAAERPECVAAAIVYNHLDAFFTQSIAAVPNDPTANEVLEGLRSAVGRGQPIATAVPAEYEAYLGKWESRVEEIVRIRDATPVTDKFTITDLAARANPSASLKIQGEPQP